MTRSEGREETEVPIGNIKRLLREQMDLAPIIRHEAESNGDPSAEDRREALRAFAEKRTPVFHGR